MEPLEGAFEIALHSPEIKTNSQRKPQKEREINRERERETAKESEREREQAHTN